MVTTRHISISLSFLILFSFSALGKAAKKGHIILLNGQFLEGYIAYRKIDAATRVVYFPEVAGKNKKDKTKKQVYKPNEIMGFTYGTTEVWWTVSFTEKELGYAANYFMKEIETNGPFILLGGMITGEGCNCSGTKIDASYFWVLLHITERKKLILSEHKFGRIEKPEWVSAFFSGYGYNLEPDVFTKPKGVFDALE